MKIIENPNSVLLKHRQYLKTLELKKNLLAEEAQINAEEKENKTKTFKENAAKQRLKIKTLKENEVQQEE